MPRNIVICCDGTNNSLVEPFTNIGHLSRLANVGDDKTQFVYYDAGVGSEPKPTMKTGIGAKLSQWSGSAFGAGLVDNVKDAYQKLAQLYLPGDRVYMFGFSRGAYTVRVIAGLLQNYYLLKAEHKDEAGRVVKAFRNLYPKGDDNFVNGAPTASQQARFDERDDIRARLAVTCPIHFMGIFDTVSSLGWAWDPETFPNTRKLSNVTIVRHAMAIDERRAKFRTNRFELVKDANHKQIWFAGVHSDVGGGYPAPRNLLARVPLRWMLREAVAAGMRVNQAVFDELKLGEPCATDEQAEQNESLSGFWYGLEYTRLPHWEEVTPNVWKKGKRMYRGEGWRELPDTFEAHDSLMRRTTPVKNIHWRDALAKMRFWS